MVKHPPPYKEARDILLHTIYVSLSPNVIALAQTRNLSK